MKVEPKKLGNIVGIWLTVTDEKSAATHLGSIANSALQLPLDSEITVERRLGTIESGSDRESCVVTHYRSHSWIHLLQSLESLQ